MFYYIGEFSKRVGISAYTLRYYEKEGLFFPKRDENNRRIYSEDDIGILNFIKRLKDTGMPIQEIREYAALRIQGDSTFKERLNLLLKHKQKLEDQVNLLKENQEKLEEKINFYRNRIEQKEP